MLLYRLVTILFFIPLITFGQTTGQRNVSFTLPSVALVDLEPSGGIILNFTAPIQAGQPLVLPSTNSDKWLNYTSALPVGGVSRSITAAINQTIPGVQIRLQAAGATGIGAGVRGVSNGEIILSAVPQSIVTGIAGAYTGSGPNNGHRLSFNISIIDYQNLSASDNNIIIIQYTISD